MRSEGWSGVGLWTLSKAEDVFTLLLVLILVVLSSTSTIVSSGVELLSWLPADL